MTKRMSAIQDEPPFTTPGEWRRLMATLPETALVSLIEAKSQVMDLAWLNTMVEGGLLSITKDLAELQTLGALEDLVDTWTERIRATTKFMTGITTEPLNKSPVYGELEETIALAVFGAPEAMKDFYVATSLALADDFNALISHPLLGKSQCLAKLQEPMAQWIGGAVLLNLSDAVRQLGEDMPEAVTGFFPMKALGNAMLSYALPDEKSKNVANEGPLEFFISPQALALMLSREICLEALWDHGATVHDTIFIKQYSKDSDVDMGVVDLLSFMHPTSLPETWAKMLKKGFSAESDEDGYDANDVKEMLAMAIKAMDSPTHPWMRNYIPALIDVGIYNSNPNKSFMKACKNGCVDVIESLEGRIDWDAGADGPLTHAIKTQALFMAAAANCEDGRPGQFEKGVLKVIEMGVKNGHADLVFKVAVHNDGSVSRSEPVCSFADAKFHRALVMFLENGLDPHAAVGNAPSLLAYADEHAPEAAHVMRTFEARRQSMKAMENIGNEQKPGTSVLRTP